MPPPKVGGASWTVSKAMGSKTGGRVRACESSDGFHRNSTIATMLKPKAFAMRLKTVTLKNFRCFESITLDLHPRLTVIVGDNGAGKTALLDGIASGLTPVLTHLSSANQRLGGRGLKDSDFRLQSFKGPRGKTQWSAADYTQIMLTNVDGLRWDYWRPSGSHKGVKPVETWGETKLKECIDRITASYNGDTPALTPVFAYYGANRGIEVPERLRSVKHNYEHPTAALVDCFDAHSDFREMLAWFDLEESSELRENKNATDETYSPFASLEAVRDTVISVLGNAYRNPQFNTRHKFILERVSDGAEMLVNQLSQGYQSMLALSMDFARRLALANRYHDEHRSDGSTAFIEENLGILEPWDPASDSGPFVQQPFLSAPAIMLVDEIDVHLHPSWQQRVLADLMRAFPLTQFIVTTHSPQVLSTVPSEAIRILRDGQVMSAPIGTEGAEPGRLLKTAFGLKSERPPENQATKELQAYLDLVAHAQEDSREAQELRKKLDERYQGNEPALLEADLLIENRKWELGE